MFDPKEAGFRWPTPESLTGPDEAVMRIRPYGADLPELAGRADTRDDKCHRYYATDQGILNELELETWMAGGAQACWDLLGAYQDMFDTRQTEELPLADVVAALQAKGFHATTIMQNLSWLVQDSYADIYSQGGGPTLRRLKR